MGWDLNEEEFSKEGQQAVYAKEFDPLMEEINSGFWIDLLSHEAANFISISSGRFNSGQSFLNEMGKAIVADHTLESRPTRSNVNLSSTDTQTASCTFPIVSADQ